MITRKASKILAVDDTLDNLLLLEAVFSEENYQIIFAEDGKTAIELALQHLPDLILLDVMMPGMNGYEVTKLIRQNPKTKHIPILLLTAQGKTTEAESSYAGADGILYKPFDIEGLLQKTRELLQKTRDVLEQERSRARAQ